MNAPTTQPRTLEWTPLRDRFDAIARDASLPIGPDGFQACCPTGEPYVMLWIAGPTEAEVIQGLETAFRGYLQGKTGTLYWRRNPTIEEHAEAGWHGSMRICVSGKVVTDEDLALWRLQQNPLPPRPDDHNPNVRETPPEQRGPRPNRFHYGDSNNNPVIAQRLREAEESLRERVKRVGDFSDPAEVLVLALIDHARGL